MFKHIFTTVRKKWLQGYHTHWKLVRFLERPLLRIGRACSRIGRCRYESDRLSVQEVGGMHAKDQTSTLQWRHNELDGVSDHQPHGCLLNLLFRRRSKSKLCVTGLCAGYSPVTGEFPAQKASNAENESIWWRHHECVCLDMCFFHTSPRVTNIRYRFTRNVTRQSKLWKNSNQSPATLAKFHQILKMILVTHDISTKTHWPLGDSK